jgi:hypothetical protein
MSNQPMGNDEKQSRPAKHFGDRYWIDVVRGINTSGYAAEMQLHLNAGCEVCRRDRDLWLRLFYFGRNDGFYEPPEEITQQVKGLFNKRGHGKPRLFPRLVLRSKLWPPTISFKLS